MKNRYLYLYEILGCVRLLIDTAGVIKNKYTYLPFGQMFDSGCSETVENPFKFTGQWYDKEIGQYYLRARMYDPYLARFTTFDHVRGKFGEPLTLHKYLYCINDPINNTDPSGEFLLDAVLTGSVLYNHTIRLAAYAVKSKDWRFFDLADFTAQYMKIGMAIAGAMPFSRDISMLYYWSGRTVSVTGQLNPYETTGMSVAQSLLMDPAAFAVYSLGMFIEETSLEITFSDIEEFSESFGTGGWL